MAGQGRGLPPGRTAPKRIPHPDGSDVEERLLLDIGLNGFQGLFHQASPKGLFRRRPHFRIPQRMGDAHGRYDAADPDGLRDGSDGADLARGQPGSFQFLCDRCAATSAGSSSGGEDDPGHSVGFELGSDLPSELAAHLQPGSVARGGVEILGHGAHPALAYQVTEHVQRQ